MPDPATMNLMQQRALRAVNRFLKSVVVIDNEAEMGAGKLKDNNTIDIEELSEAFSLRGLSCSVYSPKEENETVKHTSCKLIRQNDVAIVDWHLGKEGAKLCKDILKEALTLDKNEGHPPRLIIIYTVESIDESLLQTLLTDLDGLGLQMIDKEWGLEGENVRIVFKRKMNDIEAGMDPETGISPKDLPDVIIAQFNKLADGILPMSALNAVAALRDNTSHLLGIFRKELDPALLFHSLLIYHPEECVNFLVNLLSDECRVILESDSDLLSCARLDLLCEWLNTHEPIPFKTSDNKAQLKEMLVERINNTKTLKDMENFVDPDKAHRIYGTVNPDRQYLLEFMRLCSLKRESCCKHRAPKDDWKPELTQGTIIKRKDHFYMCVIPRCDSVRLNGKPARFPFIYLKKLPEDTHDAHLCLLTSSGQKCFALPERLNWHQLKIIYFTSTNNNTVQAIHEGNKFFFTTMGEDRKEEKYEWIADLKDLFITKLVADLAPGLSRIGIDEFELQRRNRGQVVNQNHNGGEDKPSTEKPAPETSAEPETTAEMSTPEVPPGGETPAVAPPEVVDPAPEAKAAPAERLAIHD